uniref:PIPK domain-containing protein n=1 Tax=Arcella intermedia TaxID=1963864 RepID=A0A6B2L5S0_9EUKA
MMNFLNSMAHKRIELEEYLTGDFATEILSVFIGISRSDLRPRVSVAKSIPFFYVDTNRALHLSLALQLSIESRYTPVLLTDYHFTETSTYTISAPKEKMMGPQNLDKNYTLTDYAPQVFKAIRKHFGIKEESLMASVGIESLLMRMVFTGEFASFQQIGSYGKSGSIFYYSFDGEFMLKTVMEKEALCLMARLKEYYEHITKAEYKPTSPGTFIVPYIGLLRISTGPSNNLYICIMKNLFSKQNSIDEIYDLKGSKEGRTTPLEDRKPGIPLKDLDFDKDRASIYIPKANHQNFHANIGVDASFLCNTMQTMDYSFLLGIHRVRNDTLGLKGDKNEDLNITPDGGWVSSDRKEIYYVGIIDYLVEFGKLKKAEVLVKGFTASKEDISVSDPKSYHLRFIETFKKIISTK